MSMLHTHTRIAAWAVLAVSLGAVRLKIIDLEHGHQPMLSKDGDTVLIFNGELGFSDCR